MKLSVSNKKYIIRIINQTEYTYIMYDYYINKSDEQYHFFNLISKSDEYVKF